VNLPRQLRTFKVRFTKLTTACFVDLPPKLEVFCSSGLIMDFTPSSTAMLPRTLIKLDLLYHSNISDQCIPHLPRQLRVLRLKYNVLFIITSACIPHLPPALRKFALMSNDFDPAASGFTYLRRGKYERRFIGHI
jgi:hypothetical protein